MLKRWMRLIGDMPKAGRIRQKTKSGSQDLTAGVGLTPATSIASGFRRASVRFNVVRDLSHAPPLDMGDTVQVQELYSDLRAGGLAMDYPFLWEKIEVDIDAIKVEWISFTFDNAVSVEKGEADKECFKYATSGVDDSFEFLFDRNDFLVEDKVARCY